MHPESFGASTRSFFGTFSPSHTTPSSLAQSIRRLHLPSPSPTASPPHPRTILPLLSLQARQLFHSSANTPTRSFKSPFPNSPHTPSSGAPFLNPLGAARMFAAAPRRADGHVDIAAKARARQAQKLWQLVGGGAVVAAFGAFVLNAFQENLVFYITPTQVCGYATSSGQTFFHMAGEHTNLSSAMSTYESVLGRTLSSRQLVSSRRFTEQLNSGLFSPDLRFARTFRLRISLAVRPLGPSPSNTSSQTRRGLRPLSMQL